MNAYVSELIAITPGSSEADKVRSAAVNGDKAALKKFVHMCAWGSIKRDKNIPKKDKLSVFRALVCVPMEVTLV